MRGTLPTPVKEEEPPDPGGIQEYGEEEHPIAHASRTLEDAELRYSATEREALAIWWACNYPVDCSDGRKVTSSQALPPPASDSNQDFGGSTDAVGVSVLAVSKDTCCDHTYDKELSAKFQEALLEIGYEYPIERKFNLVEEAERCPNLHPVKWHQQPADPETETEDEAVIGKDPLRHWETRNAQPTTRPLQQQVTSRQRLANLVPLTGIDILKLDQERHVSQSQSRVGIRSRWKCPVCTLL